MQQESNQQRTNKLQPRHKITRISAASQLHVYILYTDNDRRNHVQPRKDSPVAHLAHSFVIKGENLGALSISHSHN